MRINVPIDGTNQTFKGALLVCLADDLAINYLGFKKSFLFAFYCCCTCLVTENSLSCSYNSEAYQRYIYPQKTFRMCGTRCCWSFFKNLWNYNERNSLTDVKHFSIFEHGLPLDLNLIVACRWCIVQPKKSS